MRVGPHGPPQPTADALKPLLKEDIIPEGSDRTVFWFAPGALPGAARPVSCKVALTFAHVSGAMGGRRAEHAGHPAIGTGSRGVGDFLPTQG
jgi:hypothetical protein